MQKLKKDFSLFENISDSEMKQIKAGQGVWFKAEFWTGFYNGIDANNLPDVVVSSTHSRVSNPCIYPFTFGNFIGSGGAFYGGYGYTYSGGGVGVVGNSSNNNILNAISLTLQANGEFYSILSKICTSPEIATLAKRFSIPGIGINAYELYQHGFDENKNWSISNWDNSDMASAILLIGLLGVGGLEYLGIEVGALAINALFIGGIGEFAYKVANTKKR